MATNAIKKSDVGNSDYLIQATEADEHAQKAIKAKEFDLAWRLLRAQRTLYLKHAAKSGLNTEETLSLDGRLHYNFANILRQKGYHQDALVHVLYWCMSYEKLTVIVERRVKAYFNRAKLDGLTFGNLKKYIEQRRGKTNLKHIQLLVEAWTKSYP